MSPSAADMPPDLFSEMTWSDRKIDRAMLEKLSLLDTPVTLIRCDLEETDAARLNFRGWVFDECRLHRTQFTGAHMEGAGWTRCRGGFTDFTATDLTDNAFVSSDFNNSNFRGARLSSARFTGCKLTGANLTETKAMLVVFEETLLTAASLRGFSFRKAVLNQLDFQFADLRSCDFRDAVFDDCSLREANLADARFEGADLRGADLGGIRLQDARPFRGATISRSQASQLLAELGLNVQ